MQERRLREARLLPQGHTAGKCRRLYLNLGLWHFKASALGDHALFSFLFSHKKMKSNKISY
jgi:hypothetical protein